MLVFNMDLPISRGEDISWKLIDNRAVLLNIDEGVVLELDDTGTRIWLMIDGQISGRAIVEDFVEGFDVEKQKAEKDIRKFLKKLRKDEAIKLGKERSSNAISG